VETGTLRRGNGNVTTWIGWRYDVDWVALRRGLSGVTTGVKGSLLPSTNRETKH